MLALSFATHRQPTGELARDQISTIPGAVMDDILRSHLDVVKIDRIYRCLCLTCGAFVGASTSLERLTIAERQHRCKQDNSSDAVPDTRTATRPAETPPPVRPEF